MPPTVKVLMTAELPHELVEFFFLKRFPFRIWCSVEASTCRIRVDNFDGPAVEVTVEAQHL